MTDELAEALERLDREGRSRSRLVADLALRGAQEELRQREARREAIEHLKRIANDEDDGYDFAIVRELYEAR